MTVQSIELVEIYLEALMMQLDQSAQEFGIVYLKFESFVSICWFSPVRKGQRQKAANGIDRTCRDLRGASEYVVEIDP